MLPLPLKPRLILQVPVYQLRYFTIAAVFHTTVSVSGSHLEETGAGCPAGAPGLPAQVQRLRVLGPGRQVLHRVHHS